MNVPQKVKNLMWRACRNTLPTKTTLLRRTIIDNPLCDHCHATNEDPLHALWACSKLDVVWNDLELWGFINIVGFIDFKELLSWMISGAKNLELFAITTWTVWNQCNKVHLNQIATTLHQVALVSRAWWQEFRAHKVVVEGHVRQGSSGAEEKRWRPPSLGLVKINFDGTVFAKDNKSGAGAVIRNVEGHVIASCAKKLPAAYNKVEVETMVAAVAFSFASEINIKRAILKSDLLAVIKSLRENVNFLSPIGLLLEVVMALSQNFDELLYSQFSNQERR